MTSKEFADDSELSALWKKERESGIAKTVLDIASVESPINQTPLLLHEVSSSFSYGRAYGWNECLNFLKNLGEQRRVPVKIPPGYAAKKEE